MQLSPSYPEADVKCTFIFFPVPFLSTVFCSRVNAALCGCFCLEYSPPLPLHLGVCVKCQFLSLKSQQEKLHLSLDRSRHLADRGPPLPFLPFSRLTSSGLFLHH